MEAGADAVLLGLEQVDGDRVGVVGLEQLDLFGFELGLLRAQGGSFVGGRGSESIEHAPEHALDSGGLVGGDALLLVGVGDVAFGDLLGEVQGVELGDGGHDAVHEHPGGCLIDVLGDGHERDAGLAEGGVDDRVIETVPGKPVDLVDDAVPHRVVRDVVQHLLEGFAPGGLGGLAGFDELRHDDRAELVGLAVGGLALGGDRQAFF
ncbi:MAG TPA: hypothetical protein PKG51_02530 [Arachnia sp.]|nr:hypothetical protein [Arachnia sp.]